MKRSISRSAGIIIIVSFVVAFFLAPLIASSFNSSVLSSFLVKTSKVVSVIPTIGGRASGPLAHDQHIFEGVRIWLLLLSLGFGFGGRLAWKKLHQPCTNGPQEEGDLS